MNSINAAAHLHHTTQVHQTRVAKLQGHAAPNAVDPKVPANAKIAADAKTTAKAKSVTPPAATHNTERMLPTRDRYLTPKDRYLAADQVNATHHDRKMQPHDQPRRIDDRNVQPRDRLMLSHEQITGRTNITWFGQESGTKTEPSMSSPEAQAKLDKTRTAEPHSGQSTSVAPGHIAPAQDAELREVFSEFVGQTFFGTMLASMRKTVGKPSYMHGGRGEEVFQKQLDDQLVKELTEASASTVAEPMYDLFQMQRRG